MNGRSQSPHPARLLSTTFTSGLTGKSAGKPRRFHYHNRHVKNLMADLRGYLMGLICLWTDTSVQATVAGIRLASETGRGEMGHRGLDRRAAAVRERDELMGRPNGRDPGEL